MEVRIDKSLTTKLFKLEGLSLKELLLTTSSAWEILEHLEAYIKTKPTYVPPEGVIVEGSVFVGKGTVIRKGAYLRGPIVIGENCVIGRNVEIVRSLILDEAKIPHLSYVGDSIVGSRVNMGAGSICANTRLDKGEISIVCDGVITKTGRKKLGALIGDDASIGCNAVLNPGSIVLPGAYIRPCKNVGGIIK